jgi:flagellar assembly factor FliW
MKLSTRHFGQIEVNESDVIEFGGGLPAFEHLTHFIILAEQQGEDNVFFSLQSTQDEDVAFTLIDMTAIWADYNPTVDIGEIAELGEYNPDNFAIYNIAVIPEDVKQTTVNLKAPIVVNVLSKKAKQIVCANDDYSIRHYIFAKEEVDN